jgi:hypothetical protein
MPKINFIICFVAFFLIVGCASKPKIYHFNCTEQTPEIIYSYFPVAFSSMAYKITKIDTANNYFEATKHIRVTNKVKGIEIESIQLQIKFMFNEKQSEITQYYIKEINGKKKISALNKEQLDNYEKDALTLQEKTLFYCNPKFKGR